MSFNPKLLECAEYAVHRTKTAFVPPGGGALPMDPAAMMGGAPPGMVPGAPPMDPAAMMGGAPPGMAPGAAPPMDPSAMAGMGAMPMGAPADPASQWGAGSPSAPPLPSPGGIDPEMLRSIIREEIAAIASGNSSKSKGSKITPEQMYQEALRTRKLLTHMFGLMNWGLPPDILDDTPPSDGSGAGNGGNSNRPKSGSTGGQPNLPIGPIPPIAPAVPMKAASDSKGIVDSADALLRILRGM